MNFIFPLILGISSSQLTNSIIFQRGWLKPPTSNQRYVLQDSQRLASRDSCGWSGLVGITVEGVFVSKDGTVPRLPFASAIFQTMMWERQGFFSGREGSAWWLIPLSKWVITPVINGISRVNPLITGVITHLLSGMNHQVGIWLQHIDYTKNWEYMNDYHCL